MNTTPFNLKYATLSLMGLAGLLLGLTAPQTVYAQASTGGIDLAQQPLFIATGQPPLNMLVMGKDHKLYYEAYNDTSDLNGDGVIDINYKPSLIDYYGYFDSHRCYTYSSSNGEFNPSSVSANKKCSGEWSGDFLNYLTTSRMDALRKVLYGGTRVVDTSSRTVLERSYIPQDAHSWGKEYTSVAENGYRISDYTPLSQPTSGRRHLFANTTLRSDESWGPRLRVLQNSPYRIWEWVSIERPVAGDRCLNGGNGPDCVSNGNQNYPGHPGDRTEFNTMESTYAIPAYQYGGTYSQDRIDCGSNCNLGGSDQDEYMTIITGEIIVRNKGNYRFRVNGDDAIDFQLYDATGNPVVSAGCYGPRGFGTCGGNEIGTANGLLAGTYTFKFRQEEAYGGDGYKLEWQRTQNTNGGGNTNSPNFNWTVLRLNSANTSNGNGGFVSNVSLKFYDLSPASVSSSLTDYRVRVEVCKAPTVETNCKVYPNGGFKPTGILHTYGESDRMFFGLLTGSYAKNTQGGVLRSNMNSFSREINANSGIFNTNITDGIVYTIDHQRTIEFNTNYTYACGWIGDRAVNDGECSMWGNPVAEMMYETLRYFSGASAPRSEFNIPSNAKDANSPLSLARPSWKAPYAPVDQGGGGHLACSIPVMTVISDINPSYDFSVPGTRFGSMSGASDPAPLNTLDVSSQVDSIWASEGGGSRTVFIGESNGVSDSAPTAKVVNNLSSVRGLAPEEPSKQGTYYSAGVARFGATHHIGGDKETQTYAVALASPLPRIDFPVGTGRITLVPFAKSVGGAYNISPTSNFQPTDQIVDFYVQKIANVDPDGSDTNTTINGGRPYAEFRINYEDVEQGADHDMDAIALYTLSVNDEGKMVVSISSEYAAGSIDQHMGYVISGTNNDGIYLEVCDLGDGKTNNGNRNSCANQTRFKLNTPPGRPSGWCVNNLSSDECVGLPPTATRTFTPGTTTAAGLLKDPLWYAAKYGSPSGIPTVDSQGQPLNYFLVTNATNLQRQLDNAFSNIIANSQPTASVATSTPRYAPGATLAYEASYTSDNWSGDLKAYNLRSDAVYTAAPPVWSASSRMPSPSNRKIFTGKYQGSSFTGVPFTTAGLDTALKAKVQGSLDPAVYPLSDLIDYLRGDQSKEQGGTSCNTPLDCPFRKRGTKLGDILNSTPAVVGVTSFGYGSSLMDTNPTAASSYAAFVESKKAIFGNKSETPIIFVGANDGMLHAINGSEGTNGGKEIFGYIPNAALGNLQYLASPSYTHRFYVDASPTVGDAYFSGWHSVLMGSMGAGGKAVFALDITDPNNFSASNVMWEFNSTIDADMGQFVGRPYMGMSEGGTWIGVFGNGYNSARHHAVLFVRNLETGEAVAKVDTGVGCSSLLAGCLEGPNGLSTAVLVDNNGNGLGDTIYAGDYLGNMWRFEYSNGSWILGNNGVPLFQAKDPDRKPQSITSGLYTVANPIGGTMLVFGTGRYLNADDADEDRLGLGTRASVESIYGIWDSRMWNDANSTWTSTFPILSRADLERQWITGYNAVANDGSGGYRSATRNPVDFRTTAGGDGKMGWYLDLTCTDCADPHALDGERVTSSPQGILSNVVFNTFRPEGDSCEPGSQNATMVLDTLTGAADYTPIAPPGGWPTGQEPPALGIVGTDTGKGPPPGEPPIVIIRPPNPTVPCLPGDESCVPEPECDPQTDPSCEPPVTTCSWRSPNAAGRPPGKLIPCGRISWKQLR